MIKILFKGVDFIASLLIFGFYRLLYINKLSISGLCRSSSNFSLQVFGKQAKVSLNNINIRKNITILVDNGHLQIDKNVFLNNACSINCLYHIHIAANTILGENVKLYDHNHKYTLQDIPIKDQGFTYGKISIGKNCWIGSNVVVLKNVSIGDNVIIGAGCIIYESIDSNSIVINNQNLIIKKKNK